MGRLKNLKAYFSLMYRRHTIIFSIMAVVIFTLLANFSYIFITNPDPVLLRSGLPIQNSSVRTKFPFAGGNSIEPNDGFTKQALGIEANDQILSGKLPLWNHYEGIGAPLLGETQSAALFPFTLLLSLPYGFLINEIILEIIAGVGMYLFIRRISDKSGHHLDNLIAITAGCLFSTLGTFMMLPNACFNPIAFLPWSMLGVALIFSGKKKIQSRKNIAAMLVFAFSIILSLNSGFPEIAYINLLLAFAYAIILFIKTKNNEKISRFISLALPTLVAILASLPWLVEFLTYINPANGSSGIHNQSILWGLSDTANAYLSSFIPNITGYGTGNPVYGDIGGFFTISSIILAIFAVLNKNIQLRYKLLFGGWFLIGWLRIIGFSPVSTIIAHVPMLGSTAVYRYIDVSMSFSLIVLACLGLNQVVHSKDLNKRVFAGVSVFTVLFYGFILYGARVRLKDFFMVDAKHALFGTFFLELSIFASLAVLVAIFTKWKYKKQFICIVLVLESLLCFSVWQLGAYHKSATVDTRSIQFIQQNIKQQRFESNFINSNYGSYFNISQLNMGDLPIPTLWSVYINKNMDPAVAAVGALSYKFDTKRIEQDRFLGVKYLVVVKGSLDEGLVRQENLKLVYNDSSTEIFEIPGYEQYLSGEGCLISDGASFDKFTVSCKQNSQLIRRELFYLGWHVKVDGKEVDIQKYQNLFQQVSIGKGQHEVEFYYWPRYMTISIVIAGSVTVVMLGASIFLIITRIRSKS